MLQNECPKMGVHWVRRKKNILVILSIFILQLVKYLCVSINDIIYQLFYGIHNVDFTYRMFFFFFSRNLMVLTFDPEKQLPLTHTYTVMQKRKLSQVLEAT